MNKIFFRFFDLFFALTGVIILLPVFGVISIFILFGSKGEIFYRQSRVGRFGKLFLLWKFRTMRRGSDKSGLITIGNRDARVTRIGYFLRKYKLDELPQLVNVLKGEMSLVGPRPEVEKYVNLYSAEQRKVLSVKPGITDFASIEYANENELLGKSTNPDKTYIEEIMPAKILLNMKFIEQPTLKNYFTILWKTVTRIF